MKKAIALLLISLVITACRSFHDEALSHLDNIERAYIVGSDKQLEDASLSYIQWRNSLRYEKQRMVDEVYKYWAESHPYAHMKCQAYMARFIMQHYSLDEIRKGE